MEAASSVMSSAVPARIKERDTDSASRNFEIPNIIAEPVRLAGIIEDSIVDGPGMRFVIFVQGCPHYCKGCHNADAQDFNGGFNADIYKIADKIIKSRAKRLTFSGGEPFCQPRELAKIAQLVEAEAHGIEIITYTGYLYEELLEKAGTDAGIKDLLTVTNYLVDGKFEQDKKSLDWFYRGSSNQRIFDVTCYPNSSKARLIERREDLR
ncbi:MAG: anaerobic ribonucleoside-triphosphate reductase activating protein [Oscillospiraceae bacterium]|nr:anaerobic ribonucleoside-triphosphate reductase activating protein [Oscillospiraceae bacterium]